MLQFSFKGGKSDIDFFTKETPTKTRFRHCLLPNKSRFKFGRFRRPFPGVRLLADIKSQYHCDRPMITACPRTRWRHRKSALCHRVPAISTPPMLRYNQSGCNWPSNEIVRPDFTAGILRGQQLAENGRTAFLQRVHQLARYSIVPIAVDEKFAYSWIWERA